ncbi:M14 family metallopeptidase [Devosia sp. ZB163]|uniref:succinylglutamate desuccinylase/aspartoacylase family protein n=1 Tax=Devosia sp. ZB163 TaxID=3025938 RepID=UPI00235EEFC1|nr:succinylglutamate desuccinylase/aspartoacylase family protein [Devosia sp. ZB163]MDC9825408.1 M14 family metallopeptidase [Devosia sp. ZB163]
MAFERKVVPLRGDTPGAITEFTYYVVGPKDAPEKVHLQAALHADEHPGTMVLHHLLPMLRQADDQGLLRARFTVMPLVNPLGMATFSLRRHIGRYDANTGINFNRRWPDLFQAVRSQLAGRLSDDERFNVNLIRKAVANWIDAQQPRSAAEQLRLLVMKEAHDAEFVFDLHCDDDSLIHIFTSPELMPELQDLADWMGAAATLTAADSGGGSFDEVLPQLYRKVALANPGKPVPMASATATLEYRGQADVFDELGADDARRLWGFLCGRNLIDADPGERPAPLSQATPFDATEIVRADRPGLVAYRVDLGELVRKGQPVADLIALDGPEAFMARTPILAGTDGLVLSRAMAKYAPRGAGIMKIVGTAPLVGRKGAYLLED